MTATDHHHKINIVSSTINLLPGVEIWIILAFWKTWQSNQDSTGPINCPLSTALIQEAWDHLPSSKPVQKMEWGA